MQSRIPTTSPTTEFRNRTFFPAFVKRCYFKGKIYSGYLILVKYIFLIFSDICNGALIRPRLGNKTVFQYLPMLQRTRWVTIWQKTFLWDVLQTYVISKYLHYGFNALVLFSSHKNYFEIFFVTLATYVESSHRKWEHILLYLTRFVFLIFLFSFSELKA